MRNTAFSAKDTDCAIASLKSGMSDDVAGLTPALHANLSQRNTFVFPDIRQKLDRSRPNSVSRIVAW